MSTTTKVIAMLNKCSCSLDVQEVWATVWSWHMTEEEFEVIEAIVMAEFACYNFNE